MSFEDVEDSIRNIKKSEKGFGLFAINNDFLKYINYYNFPSRYLVDYVYGFLRWNDKVIWCVLVRPIKTEVCGTVIFVHGYQSHIGDQKNVVFDCISKNKAIILFDLPGHGLSYGEESYIDSFDEYVDCLDFVVKELDKFIFGDVEFFGHSQGCAILSKYAIDKKNLKLTYFAPMNRLYFWYFVKILSILPIDKMTGIKANVSSDESYNNFAKQDPRQSKRITKSWLIAAVNIHKELMTYTKFDDSNSLIVIQGKKDKVVDWKFNVFYFASRFKDMRLRVIDGANHQLQNESDVLRQKIFS